MSKRSASTSALEELHAAMAGYLKGRLQESTASQEVEYDEDGNELDNFVLPLATGEVANIIMFLKHNNISAAPDAEVISELSDEFSADLEAQRIAKAEGLLAATDVDAEMYEWLK